MRVFHHALLKYGHENGEMQKRNFHDVTLIRVTLSANTKYEVPLVTILAKPHYIFQQGDSGSGLVCEGDDGRWYAVGLVSIGNKCGEISFYTRISQMIDFVAVVLGDNPPKGT